FRLGGVGCVLAYYLPPIANDSQHSEAITTQP
ncbi:MAG: hypothetical protein K0S63_681, partial [Gammaproteobacteria bacterium]|nr:hypothetical protein [Gammaproteobacteria bacterium]